MTEVLTLTNPHTLEVWTSGKKGRKPNWVLEMIETGTCTKKDPVSTSIEKAEVLTFTNPHTQEVWSSDKKGRKPNWVLEMIETGTCTKKEEIKSSVPKEDVVYYTNPHTKEVWSSDKKGRKPQWVTELIETGTVTQKEEKSHNNETVVWWLRGQDEEGGINHTKHKAKCFVYADTEAEALVLLNKVFIYSVSQAEFNSMWKKGTAINTIHNNKKGVYQRVQDAWVERSQVTK